MIYSMEKKEENMQNHQQTLFKKENKEKGKRGIQFCNIYILHKFIGISTAITKFVIYPAFKKLHAGFCIMYLYARPILLFMQA